MTDLLTIPRCIAALLLAVIATIILIANLVYNVVTVRFELTKLLITYQAFLSLLWKFAAWGIRK